MIITLIILIIPVIIIIIQKKKKKKKKKKKTLVIIKFHRLSNCYFLLGMIATMTGYSSINPISQAMPLIFVLGVTAIKDAFSDYVHIKINKINK